MWDYTKKVKDHFLHPRNVGEIEKADAVGEVGNLACGDMLKLMLKIDKEKEVILYAKFQTFGCASAIASSSALTEIIKGMTIDEASKVSNDDIAEYLGGLPEEKMHCSVMGQEALEQAIATYRGIVLEERVEEGTIVCKCFGVTDQKIARVVSENKLTTVEQVTHYCKAGGGCGKCKDDIENIIKEVIEKDKQKEGPAVCVTEKKELTNIQKIKLIEETIEHEIKPKLVADGGGIELVDVDSNKVIVALRGACSECPSAGITLKSWVEVKLKEFVSDDLYVVEVKQ
ncbi:MAG: Fe-S cluster assembly protein NifU [Candidatus Ancaeobacter aquaticus]|nr:Fe-S cluster assembly protein NifU [Candidatus Ancaeobacter aquaticus]